MPSPLSLAPTPLRAARPEPLSAPRRARLLEHGRELERRGDLAGATSAFETILLNDAGDDEALAELSWVRFRHGALESAEAGARLASNRGRTSAIRGAALYTLGRIHQRRGDPERAAVAFAESLRERPSEVVERDLAALGLKAFATPSPRRMAGPFPDLRAFCAAEEAACPPAAVPAGGDLCDELPLPAAPAAGPVRALHLIATRCGALRAYHVLAETGRGLHAARTLYAHGHAMDGRSDHALSPLSIDRADDLLLLRYQVSVTERAPLRSDTDEYMVLIGSGRSGAPSNTPPILVRATSVLGTRSEGRQLLAELPLHLTPLELVLDAPRLRGPTDDEFFLQHLSQRPTGRFPLRFP